MSAAAAAAAPAAPPPLSVASASLSTRINAYIDRWRWQVSALVKKNLRVLSRRPVSFLASILTPALFVVFIVWIQSISGSKERYQVDVALQRCHTKWFEPGDNCHTLAFAPSTDARVVSVMKLVAENADLEFDRDVVGYATGYDLAFDLYDRAGRIQTAAFFTNTSDLLTYQIWANSSNSDAVSVNPFYHTTKIDAKTLAVEIALDEAIISTLSGNAMSFHASLNTLDTVTRANKLIRDRSSILVDTIVGPVLALAIVVFALIFLNIVLTEKRMQLVSFLRMMGLFESAYWLSWALGVLVLAFAAALTATIVGKLSGLELWELCAFEVHLIALWLTLTASGCSALAFAAVVSRALWSNVVNFLFIFSVTVNMLLSAIFSGGFSYLFSDGVGTFWKVILGVQPAMLYTAITSDIAAKTSARESYGWSDLFETGDEGRVTWGLTYDRVETSFHMWMLLAQIGGYVFLAWYFGQVFAGDGGATQNAWFLLSPEYWGFTKRTEVVAGDTVARVQDESGRSQNVRLHKISKAYDSIQAVKELSLSIEHGEILSLLGPNGAGKSTTIGMITGQVQPTHGYGFVLGLSVQTQGADIQDVLGVCPQKNLLWPELTAHEHLDMIGSFKLRSTATHGAQAYGHADLKEQIADRLKRFKFNSMMARGQIASFSGGMKRTLQIALATLGRNRMVLLDEPSSGLDALKRRQIWGELQKLKRDVVMICTTHDMEEADFLGDKVAIMHEGRLRAYGTPLYLKNRFGSGWKVRVLTQQQQVASLAVTKLLGPGAKPQMGTGDSLEVLVPPSSLSRLPRLMRWLESADGNAIVQNWGVSGATLEEVFLSVAANERQVNQATEDQTYDEQQGLCHICQAKPSEEVLLFTSNGVAVRVASGHVCKACAEGQSVAVLGYASGAKKTSSTGNDEDAEETDQKDHGYEEEDDDELLDLSALKAELAAAAASAAAEAEAPVSTSGLPTLPNVPGGEGNVPLDAVAHPQTTGAPASSTTAATAPPAAPSGAAGGSLPPPREYREADHGMLNVNYKPDAPGQFQAIFLKNVVYAGKFKKYNMCLACWMFLAILVMLLTPLPDVGGDDVGSLSVCDNDKSYFNYTSPNWGPGQWTGWCDSARMADRFLQEVAPSAAHSTPEPTTTTTATPIPTGSLRPTAPPGDDEPQRPLENFVTRRVRPHSFTEAVVSSRFTDYWSPAPDMQQYNPVKDPAYLSPSSPWNAMRVWYSDAPAAADREISIGDLDLLGLGPGNNEYRGLYELSRVAAAPGEDLDKEGRSRAHQRLVDVQRALLEQGLTDVYETCGLSYVPHAIMPNFGREGNETPFLSERLRYMAPHGTSLLAALNQTAASFPDVAVSVRKASRTRLDAELLVYSPEPTRERPGYPMTQIWVGPDGRPSPPNGTTTFQPATPDCGVTGMFAFSTTTPFFLWNQLVNGLLRLQPGYETQGTQVKTLSTEIVYFRSLSFPNQRYDNNTFFFLFMVVTMLHFPQFARRYATEREEKLYHQMRVAGLGVLPYWVGNYLADLLLSFGFNMILVVVGVVFEANVFSSLSSAAPVILTFFLWAHAEACMAALVSAVLKASAIPMASYTLLGAIIIANDIMNNNIDEFGDDLLAFPFFAYPHMLARALARVPHGYMWVKTGLWLFFGGVWMFVAGVIIHYIRDEGPRAVARSVAQGVVRLLNKCGLLRATSHDHEIELLRPADGFDEDPDVRKERMYAIQGTAGARSKQSAAAGGEGESGGGGFAALSTPAAAAVELDALEDGRGSEEHALQHVSAKTNLAIRVAGLSKSFASLSLTQRDQANSTFLALSDLYLALEYGESFGLLGPNGAGKTTTLSILSGLIRSTSGVATVGGFDLQDERSGVYSILGVCPQEDPVWAELTVSDHFRFFARLRGVPRAMERAVVQRTAEMVNLDGDAFNMRAETLSGGQRRRLSLGSSLIGSPRVWLLDEPSTGLDPEARRKIWHIVESQQKMGRCVVITTHLMHEADALCNRIGILVGGRLRCVGNQFRLKKRFGSGYTLTLDLTADTDPAQTAARIQEHVSAAATITERVGTKLVMALPSNTTGIVGLVFQTLQLRKDEWGILEWGLSQCSLADVFERIVRQSEDTRL